MRRSGRRRIRRYEAVVIAVAVVLAVVLTAVAVAYFTALGPTSLP